MFEAWLQEERSLEEVGPLTLCPTRLFERLASDTNFVRAGQIDVILNI